MQVDPSRTFASLSFTAKNRHVVETLRDALSGAYPWPIFVRARDARVATDLLHTAANYMQGDLSRSVEIARTTWLRSWIPSMRRTALYDRDREHESLTRKDVLLVDGIDESPINAETIIALARAMEVMHASKRPVVTFASLSNDAADGLLAQLTTRFAGGRPLEWHSTPARKARRAA